MRHFTMGLAGVCLMGGAAWGQTAPTAEGLLQAAKAASGGAAWDRVTTWHETGELVGGGLRGSYESWTDLAHVRSAGTYILGPASGAQGYDGHVTWSTDSSGEVQVQTSAGAMADAVQQTYLGAWGFFFPQRLAATLNYAGTRVADGATYDAVKVVPRGAEPVELWFDRTTHLVAREVQLTGAHPVTQLLQDYVAVDGVTVPRTNITRTGDNPRFDQTTHAARIVFNETIDDSRYAPPKQVAYDATFPAGKSSVTVPFHLYNNHIYLDAALDGRQHMFMFDTGAVNFLGAAQARQLGIKADGTLPGDGFGSSVSDVGLAKLGRVSIGGMELKDQVFAVQDDSDLVTLEGVPSVGLVGYEFAKRAVLTVDYARGLLTLTRPDAFRPPAVATPIPFTFDQHVPMVKASVDGVEGEFEVDTGSRGGLTLMQPFAQAHGLVAKYHATRLATTGYGVGGPSRSLLARVGELRIGPVSVRAPVTDLAMDKAGAAQEARVAGNLGSGLLKRFTLTLDYGHQLMWLQPNATADQRDVFDRSGIWITRAADGAILVADVTQGSAAAKAGLRAGDEIATLDGHAAAGLKLYDVREMFTRPVGTSFTLGVRGRKVRLVLADQV